jgi:HD-GYP domain-containing protein (c-di-GMP phosphodiesterase class II)
MASSMTPTLSTVQVAALPNLYPGYVHISLRTLVQGSRCPCTLRLEAYNSTSQSLRLVVAQEAGARLEKTWLQRLLQAGISHAYISQDDLERLQEYLRAQARRTLAQTPGDLQLQLCLIYEQALCSLRAAMLEPRNGRRLASGVATVRHILDMIWQDDRARQGLLKVMTSEGRLARHCLNACLLGLGVARDLGWPRQQAENLGLALFFHDLGLAEQPGGSDCSIVEPAEDDAALREHPRLSRDFLDAVPDLAPEVLETVFNHHENLDGSGYPQGLAAPALSLGSRLARIVDFYEAATAGRTPCQGLSPFQVLSHMRREMKSQVDQELLEALVRFLGHV